MEYFLSIDAVFQETHEAHTFTEDGILFLFSLHNDLQTNILGEFPP
jgi:hypothetical protein